MSDKHLAVSQEPVQKYIQLFLTLRGHIIRDKEFTEIVESIEGRDHKMVVTLVDEAITHSVTNCALMITQLVYGRSSTTEFDHESFQAYTEKLGQLGQLLRDWDKLNHSIWSVNRLLRTHTLGLLDDENLTLMVEALRTEQVVTPA